jgi:putative DNA primase/helicase
MPNIPRTCEDFLFGLYLGRVDNSENVAVLGFHADPKQHKYWQAMAMYDELPACIQQEHNGYFNISMLNENADGNIHAKKQYVARTNIIMVDDLTQEQINDLPIEPTYSVETSPNNYQLGYLLDEPLADRDTANKLMQEIGKSCGGDPGANNIVRWARLPFCSNTKQSVIDVYGQPFPTRLDIWKPENKFSPQEIADSFNIDIRTQQKPSTKQAAKRVDAKEPQTPLTDDHLLRYLQQEGMLSGVISDDGWHELDCCPWYETHTEQDPQGAGYGPIGTGTDDHGNPYEIRRFHCFHGHCADKDISDLYQYLIENGCQMVDEDLLYLNAASLKNLADKIIQETVDDPGCCYEPSSVVVLARLMDTDQAAWQRIRSQLKKISGVQITALQKLLDNKSKAGKRDTKPEQVDQLTVARSMVQRVGNDNILHTLSSFYVWDDKGVWKQTDDKIIQKRVHGVLEEQFPSLHISQGLARGIVKVAEAECFREGFSFNQIRNCINCRNGELHFVNGQFEFKQHDKFNYLTSQIPVTYDENAKAPLFEQFLNDVFDGDPEQKPKVQLIIQLMGYSLLPTTQFETFVILIGMGANGKSVLLKILKALIGKDNVSAVQPSQFDNKFQRAHLNNKLANIVSEIKSGEKIDDNAVKAITSGESSTVEEKFKPPYEIEPFCTLWFGTNHMPGTTDFSDGTFRRARVIPFNRQFPEEEQDRDLAEKLITELPGILNLCLEGLKSLFHDNKFTEVEEVTQAVYQWRKENDQVSQFIDDCCDTRADGYAKSANVYDAYKKWARDNGVHKYLTQNLLTNRLRQFNVRPGKKSGFRVLVGLILK